MVPTNHNITQFIILSQLILFNIDHIKQSQCVILCIKKNVIQYILYQFILCMVLSKYCIYTQCLLWFCHQYCVWLYIYVHNYVFYTRYINLYYAESYLVYITCSSAYIIFPALFGLVLTPIVFLQVLCIVYSIYVLNVVYSRCIDLYYTDGLYYMQLNYYIIIKSIDGCCI